MKIKRGYAPVLVVAGVGIGIGLALLVALFVSAGTAVAQPPGIECNMTWGPYYACTGNLICWGPSIMEHAGCYRARVTMSNPAECCGRPEPAAANALQQQEVECFPVFTCLGTLAKTGGSIWLADVCEPDDGFSANGEMTIDSNFPGPLKFGASFDGPWVEVEVNGPPWVVTEEMLESFAEMAGVEDWHDLWVRSGDGYPQYLGNMIIERDGRMDLLCAE
jgi:hypothetical protein